MRVFSVSASRLEFGNRLVPSFYYYTQIVKQNNLKKGISYIELGKYSKISDGEHSHIPRNNKGGIRYLYGRNIKEGIIDFDSISDDAFISPSDFKNFTRCHINQNDVLIAIYGTVGKSAIYKEEYVGIAGIPRHIANITLRTDAPITKEYLTSFFRSELGKWQLFSITTGNIQQLLSLKNLRKFEVPIAKTQLIKQVTNYEQEAIACEIESKVLIDKAREIMYSAIHADLSSIDKENAFTVMFSDLCENNIWSSNFYNKLYVNTEMLIRNCNGSHRLRDIVTVISGDEVGSDCYVDFINRQDTDVAFIRTSDIVNFETDLYPDYYVPHEVVDGILQDVLPADVVFTKDGKIGCVGMITAEDKVLLASGLVRLRLNKKGIKSRLTQEYLFIALSTKEIGYYGAMRRTVVASTIPHLRKDRLKDIEIPIIDSDSIQKITELVQEAYRYKARRKKVMRLSDKLMDDYYKSI